MNIIIKIFYNFYRTKQYFWFRSGPTLVELKLKFIYALGGLRFEEHCVNFPIYACQKYDIKNDKWSLIPSLLQSKGRMHAFICSDHYIYVNEDDGNTITKLTEIQRFNICNEEAGWEIIRLDSIQREIKNMCFIFSINRSIYKVVSQHYKKENTNNSELFEHFYELNDLFFKKGVVYTFDDFNEHLGAFNTIKCEWKVINFL